MKPHILFVTCLTFLGCATSQRSIPHVAAEEAAWFKVPATLPDTGRQTIPGVVATAIQLAMDDFLPRDLGTPKDAGPQALCLAQRQSYDVEAAPGPEGVVWVSIHPSPGACRQSGPLLDTGSATYAVDVQQWRILAVQHP
ncbi:hypothetical protein [Hyalangium gracile]|uniref:hypothetical protein n=1 Tax=Hyalangium gracile TaxID=394092 RepID=UPI001CCB2BD1|nr:hypothetical protein [Hyalangium gracile]